MRIKYARRKCKSQIPRRLMISFIRLLYIRLSSSERLFYEILFVESHVIVSMMYFVAVNVHQYICEFTTYHYATTFSSNLLRNKMDVTKTTIAT